MSKRGMIRVEFLALRSEIQDKLDKGWPVSRIWGLLRSGNRYSGGQRHFNKLVKLFKE